MGVTNAFEKANDLLAKELRFTLDPKAGNSEFRRQLYFCGWARFEHCVALCKLWAKPTATGAQKYARLIDLMKLVTPGKTPGTKYRNPATGAAVAGANAMDREALDAAARERCLDHKTRNCAICEPLDVSKLPA